MGCQQYFQEMLRIIDQIQQTQGEDIRLAANIIAECVRQDGIVHTFGIGHSRSLAEDVMWRAGTLAPINAILEPSMTGYMHATKSGYMEKVEGTGKIIVDYHRIAPPDVLAAISTVTIQHPSK